MKCRCFVYFAFLALSLNFVQCAGSTSNAAVQESEEEKELIPLWDSYDLPDLDSTFSMIEEDFYDGRMRIMGEDFTTSDLNTVTVATTTERTVTDSIFQWCYCPTAFCDEGLELQFMPVSGFNNSTTTIDLFVPDGEDDIVSEVLYEDDSTYLYEFYSKNDRGKRKFYNYLIERNGYYIISGPNVRYDLDSPEVMLYSLSIAESFQIMKPVRDHSKTIWDYEYDKWKR